VPLRVTFKDAGEVATVLTVPPLELAVNSITFVKPWVSKRIALFLALRVLLTNSFAILFSPYSRTFDAIWREVTFESTAKLLFLAVVPLH
jgi:hypothetical protein